MHSIDLSKYSYRTDLILDKIDNISDNINHSDYNGIKVDRLEIDDSNKSSYGSR